MRSAAGKAMNLPPRDRGPHSWLWRLLFREASTLTSHPGALADRDEAAAWLWQGIQNGWLWVRGDRSGVSPGDPDPWLRELVEAEARRHVSLGDQAAQRDLEASTGEGDSAVTDVTSALEEPLQGAAAGRPREERQSAIAGHIWRYLSSGWARIADDEDRILFWHPTERTFVAFTAELDAEYRRLFKSLKHVGTQAERRLAAARQPYTGRRRSHPVPDSQSAYTGRIKQHQSTGGEDTREAQGE